jgi:hypothetical protein
MDDVEFARASTLSGAHIWRQLYDLPIAPVRDDPQTGRSVQPRLITLRGSQVTLLSLSDLDLRACQFFGAHGLQSLNIEPNCTWPHAPLTPRYISRDTIAEEHDLRGFTWKDDYVEPPRWLKTAVGHSSWDDPDTRVPAWLDSRDESAVPLRPGHSSWNAAGHSSWDTSDAGEPESLRGRDHNGPLPLRPEQISALYRALRKGREDGKDEAGAGDLYYGEMEMRRLTITPKRGDHGRVRTRTDHAIVTAYWLFSGYGLRASRALITLIVTVTVASFGLHGWGFTPDASYTRALLFSIESTAGLLRIPQTPGLQLTYTGEGIQIALRLLGPLLIGLALFAIRARVKR